MRQDGLRLGGEQSGHLVFLDHATTGDGVVAALLLLAAVVRSGRSASELAGCMTLLPQALVSVKVARRAPLDELGSVQAAIVAAERELKAQGRVLVRYSGTELKARVMVEGPDELVVKRMAKDIADELTRAVG
jgi:phosphoglucosamine mutase